VKANHAAIARIPIFKEKGVTDQINAQLSRSPRLRGQKRGQLILEESNIQQTEDPTVRELEHLDHTRWNMDFHRREHRWQIQYGVPIGASHWLEFGSLHGVGELYEAVGLGRLRKIRPGKRFGNNERARINHGRRAGLRVNDPVEDQRNRDELRIYECPAGRLRKVPYHYEGLHWSIEGERTWPSWNADNCGRRPDGICVPGQDRLGFAVQGRLRVGGKEVQRKVL
jgi:hypothetical protein